ncbi:MAG TPA: hypothetical protein VMI56_21050 [Reyranella sp.]|nr:hypothetical protein [Reyranella sp.]
MSEPGSDEAAYDAGNQRHVQKRARTARARDRRADEAFKWLMADPRGRLLMWERLGQAGIFRTSMASSPELTAFNEGRRDQGLRDLQRIMRLCPEQYMRMVGEAQAGHAPAEAGESGEEDGEG